MDKLLESAQKNGEQAEIYTVTHKQTPVNFENNRLKSIRSHQQEVCALRLVSHEGRMGFSTTTVLDEKSGLLENSREAAKFGRIFEMSLPTTVPPDLSGMHHQEVVEYPMTRMVELGEEIVEAVRLQDNSALTDVSISKSEWEVNIKNSEGLDTTYWKTGFSVTGAAQLMVGKSFLHVHQRKASPALFTDLEDMKEELVRDLHFGVQEVEYDPGIYPVIFAPEAVMDLMRPLLVSLNGQSVEKKVSPFRDKLGECIFDRRLHLIDKPHLPLSPGLCPVDDEGVVTVETPLIEEGTIKSFPVDLLTAKSLGVAPSGHGIREKPKSLPTPGLHACVLSPGKRELQSMIEGLHRGIIIKDLMGAWAGNPYSGEVNGNISLGFLVEEGEIKGRIKDSMVAVNAFEAFNKHLLDLTQESKWVGNYSFPYVLIDEVHLTG